MTVFQLPNIPVLQNTEIDEYSSKALKENFIEVWILAFSGGAENARVDNAGVDNAGVAKHEQRSLTYE